jgi:hypothetical protein
MWTHEAVKAITDEMIYEVKKSRGIEAAIKARKTIAPRGGNGVELEVGPDGHRPPRHPMYVEHSYLELQDTL